MMNLASRHAPLDSGTHATHANAAQNVPGGQPLTSVTHASTHQLNNSGRGSSALMSLFNSGLSVPRQMVIQARGAQDNLHIPIHLNFIGTIGQGTFGQIERATLTVPVQSTVDSTTDQSTGSKPGKDSEHPSIQVAVKRVLQDPRYKNRELSIMQRLNNHPNIVKFYYYYYSTASSSSRGHRSTSGRSGSGSSGVDVFLHLVLECFPESLCELIYRYLQRNVKIPAYVVKVFTYQMLKALAYLHSHQICHRDIKSSNLLVDESTLVLKVCDFGSAKEMVPGTANVSYISSRYYRAPELLFGAQLYTCAIDTWSGGCVLAEMLRQHCLFMGADSVDQLVKVIRVLGTPSANDIASMNPMYGSYNFPDVQPCPVKLFFPQHTPSDLLALMSKMLVYNPTLRITPANALLDVCFNELRELGPSGVLPNRVRVPPHLFDPNPPVSTTISPTSTQELGSAVAPNSLPNQDSRHWHGSSGGKKSGDGSGSDRKNTRQPVSGSREVAGDWHRKSRPSGSHNSEKNPGSGSSGHLTNQTSSTIEPAKVSVGNTSGKSGNANRNNNNPTSSTNYSRKAGDPSEVTQVADYAMVNNGTGTGGKDVIRSSSCGVPTNSTNPAFKQAIIPDVNKEAAGTVNET
ncbi:unnamed protein product [Calicophoron daubneyi]|uniref:Protein kinase domain-containing protein n=1 Tax=Calicophoron daubneyi TaxID=300641 RepID=A0AAV2T054_CALDB